MKQSQIHEDHVIYIRNINFVFYNTATRLFFMSLENKAKNNMLKILKELPATNKFRFIHN